MDQLDKLRYLSLVSKVTTGARNSAQAVFRMGALAGGLDCLCWPAELEVHLGLSEKTLSEFIIDLSKGKRNVKEFQSSLNKNGAELPASLVETIWNIIQRLMPAQAKQGRPATGAGGKYSGLAIPDARCVHKRHAGTGSASLL